MKNPFAKKTAPKCTIASYAPGDPVGARVYRSYYTSVPNHETVMQIMEVGLLEPDETLLTAVCDGRVSGVLTFTLEGASLYVHALHILPTVRGRGVGTSLIDTVIATAQRLGVPVVNLESLDADSNKFYRGHCFVKGTSRDGAPVWTRNVSKSCNR